MLKLILGRQKSGKTHRCLEIAKSKVEAGKSVVMLVPEQYSFECQRHLLEDLGPKVSNKIEIHSFTSLCEAICAVLGGLSGHNVDEGTRFILIGQAINNVRDNLKLYGKYVNSQSFIKSMMSVITEFKQSAITPETLKLLADETESELFANKLYDVALILSSYDALLKNRFIDPLDLIERTVFSMQDNSFFNGKTFILDEFKGFTEAQFNLLSRIVAGCDDIYVSLGCDGIKSCGETDIFKNIRKCATRLIQIASNHGIAVEEPDVLDGSQYFSNDINAIEQFFADVNIDIFGGDAPNITVCNAATVYDEIDFCFNTIRRMVRVDGKRYRDFVIISRDDSAYSDVVADVADVYGIPCYVDQRFPVSKLPLTVFVTSAINAALSFDSEDILRFIKTGLVGLKVNEIAELENYVYMWNINGKRWQDIWTMSSEGLSKNTNENEIKHLNELREKVVKPLISLKLNLSGNVENMCSAVLRLIDDCDALLHLKNFVLELEKNGNFEEAEYQRAGYDVFIKVLDKLVAATDSSELKPREFADMLNVALSFETVGEIPQTLDQVIYGTADRIRPMRPKVVFVVGVNQDVFPAAVNDSGLFSRTEREQMIKYNITVADRSVSDCLDEKYLLYFAVTSALEKVFISYSNTSLSGAGIEPSAEVNALITAFPNVKIIERNGQLDLADFEVPEAAFRRLAEHYRDNNRDISCFKSYFSKLKGFNSRIETLERYLKTDNPKISHNSAVGIYGDVVHLSASKTDDFAGCKFLYFCKYGIGAKKIEKVDFDQRIRGNIVHDVLDKFVKNHLSDIGNIDDKKIRNEVDLLCCKYIEENCSDSSALDEKFTYMINIIKDTVTDLAVALNKEFSQSEFRPKFCELDVGKGKTVKGIDIFTDQGNLITLNGYIDRVDTTSDGKVRVIDYKTGSKGDSFKLSELLNGTNMQMLLYLYTLLKNGQEIIKAKIPAGVLYFPAKRHIGDSKSDFVKMNGVITDDVDTIKQMEPTLEGKIVPAHLRPSGTSFYSTEAMLSQEAFSIVFQYVEILLQNIGTKILSGDITPKPLKTKDKVKCEFCDYRSVCRFDPFHNYIETTECNNQSAVEIMKKEIEEVTNGCKIH